MKKSLSLSGAAAALCLLLSGCSHNAPTVYTAMPNNVRIQLYQIDTLPSTPVHIGNNTVTPAQLQQGVLVDSRDIAMKAVTTEKKGATLLDDYTSSLGGNNVEIRNGPGNVLRADLYISRKQYPLDTLAYAFHASTTEISGDTLTYWRSMHAEHSITYIPGKTLMIGDTASPGNRTALIAFVTPI